MIKHTVCFKLKDNSPEECNKAAQILRSMEGNVELLREIEVGVDFLHSPRSYDIILQVLLDDEKALEEYQKDEYHCSVVKNIVASVNLNQASVGIAGTVSCIFHICDPTKSDITVAYQNTTKPKTLCWIVTGCIAKLMTV